MADDREQMLRAAVREALGQPGAAWLLGSLRAAPGADQGVIDDEVLRWSQQADPDAKAAYVGEASFGSPTFRDFVRQVLDRPNMNDEDADFILWERTPFPLVQGATALAPHLARVRAEDAEAAKDAEIERLRRLVEVPATGWCSSCGDLATGENEAPVVTRLRVQVAAVDGLTDEWEGLAGHLQRHAKRRAPREKAFELGKAEALTEVIERLRAVLDASPPEPERGVLVWSVDGSGCPDCREPNIHHAACPRRKEG